MLRTDLITRPQTETIQQIWFDPDAIDWDTPLHQLKALKVTGRYGEIVELVSRVSGQYRPHSITAPLYQNVAHAEFAMEGAMALTYAGATEEGIAEHKTLIGELEAGHLANDPAEDQRRNKVCGRAYNNLGYTYWMCQGRNKLALREFSRVLPYFDVPTSREELAHTCDNIGRAYSELGQAEVAERWSNQGLELRKQILSNLRETEAHPASPKQPHRRVALSLNSRAIQLLDNRQPAEACSFACEALYFFENQGSHRGIILANITMGRALRQLAALGNAYEEDLNLLTRAERHLANAIELLEKVVSEPIRLIEAHKALGWVYRDWAALLDREYPGCAEARRLHYHAIEHLMAASAQAEVYRYSLHFVDAWQALAQAYLTRGHLGDARRCLQRAEDAIPASYKADENLQFAEVPTHECVDRFWYLMGQIESLRGGIASERGGQEQAANVHYARADAYFERHHEQTVNWHEPALDRQLEQIEGNLSV